MSRRATPRYKVIKHDLELPELRLVDPEANAAKAAKAYLTGHRGEGNAVKVGKATFVLEGDDVKQY